MTPVCATAASAPLRTTHSALRTAWKRGGGFISGLRCLPEESAIAIVHDASTTAVMMATPSDLEDFAIGFSLSEGVIDAIEDIRSIEVVQGDLGVEVRVWLVAGKGQRLAKRRRRLAGPTGCGLCGVDSLVEAVRPPRPLPPDEMKVEAEALIAAMDALAEAQTLGRETRAVHAAGVWTSAEGLLAVREDVGRHNALDKLIGARARAGAMGGVVLLTSRVSVEMVQKAAVMGATILCAVSAPTALALRTAEAAGMTLVAVARSDGFEVFSHPDRVVFS
ncbi:formate dehydrogenase accessory sulfurtransferase FdhD [Brevundimonas sp.]|uniref:formate dehydrogenase accessory sulfurtransferase FdhD n=1 Tax=Brevundimonas sp. TaxID=1871086 RepID=UPI001A2F0963|nr:formate dehydrogenase accessory sulfurtransferase FdhD [Brevundimonas sp.]MBJ7486354.1 formate dehydrogenase accessory sulfurtransferase FdhD [Brevundimonas sp.]